MGIRQRVDSGEYVFMLITKENYYGAKAEVEVQELNSPFSFVQRLRSTFNFMGECTVIGVELSDSKTKEILGLRIFPRELKAIQTDKLVLDWTLKMELKNNEE